MDLIRSAYQSGSEPELLTVRFFDSVTDVSGVMKSPKSAWHTLASEKAEQLGIRMQIKETAPNELSAAFLSADECNAVVAAMQPEWKDRLLDGLEYFLRLAQTVMYDDPESWDTYIEETCQEYDFARAEVERVLLSDDAAYRAHLDMS